MTVEVELAPDVRPAIADRKADEVAHHIKSMIGVTCKVVVKSSGEVPRSQGKAVRVRDLRKQDELISDYSCAAGGSGSCAQDSEGCGYFRSRRWTRLTCSASSSTNSSAIFLIFGSFVLATTD